MSKPIPAEQWAAESRKEGTNPVASEEARDFFAAARARGRRRKSAWNFLLIPAVLAPWLLISWITAGALASLCRMRHPSLEFTVFPDTIGGILMATGSLFAGLGPSMIIANLLVAMIPAARRTLDAEAATVPGTDRRSANRDLGRFSLIATPASLLLGVAAALIGK